ncbi:MAG TPA: hypothetical protein VIG97_00960 [Luteimonas sp.]
MEFVIGHCHPCLPGHFPGSPLVPGVVVLDHVLAAIEAGHGPLGPLRLPQVKFVGPLLPGQEARVELEGGAPRWRFRVLHDDAAHGQRLVASGEVAVA